MKKDIKHIIGNIAVCALVATIASSCDKGTYTVIEAPDGEVVQNPGSVSFNIGGDTSVGTVDKTVIMMTGADGKQYTITPGTATDVAAGTYSVLAYRTSTGEALPLGMTISASGAVSVQPVNGILPVLPAIDAATATVTVAAGVATVQNLIMRRLTRELDVKGMLNGVDVSTIKDVTVALSGISSGAQMPHTVSSGGNGTVQSTAVPASDGSFVTEFNLLGIDVAASQLLTVTVNFKTGSPYTYTMDASAALHDFNGGSYTQPAGISAVINFALHNITGTITPWTPGWNEGGTGE